MYKNKADILKSMGKPVHHHLPITMTATSNKAAEVIATMTDSEPQTIHSFLKLILKPNFQTGIDDLKAGRDYAPIHKYIVFIDESSFIDMALLKHGSHTYRC